MKGPTTWKDTTRLRSGNAWGESSGAFAGADGLAAAHGAFCVPLLGPSLPYRHGTVSHCPIRPARIA